jgi:hypothetical protein
VRVVLASIVPWVHNTIRHQFGMSLALGRLCHTEGQYTYTLIRSSPFYTSPLPFERDLTRRAEEVNLDSTHKK